MTIFVPDVSASDVKMALRHFFMFGDPGLLDTILGEIPGMDTMDSEGSEESGEWGETDDSGAGGGEHYEAEDDEDETDVTGEEGDTDEDWGEEHEGVTVEEESEYNEAVEDSECYGPGDGSFVTSTGVKRNPIRSASFLGFSPTALGSIFSCSPVAEVRREAAESQVSQSGILMASILF